MVAEVLLYYCQLQHSKVRNTKHLHSKNAANSLQKIKTLRQSLLSNEIALYTITHKVGKEECESKENLYKYVRSAFQVDTQLHNTLMEKAKQNKPPVILLNVLLLEAKDLIAKDVNGSVLHRFGGSFRRKVGKKTSKIYGGTIPAKLIKASSVQKKTLNPQWNEKFLFIVDDVQTDRFHMDIWDHDDEEQSVLDAVSSLNQITGGFKGLGRFFKEVAQSARADSDSTTDDFLGCISINLNDIPPDGKEYWFPLQPRSEKSKVSGSVKLKLWLSTREERLDTEEDDLLDVKEHIELMRQFALHEIRLSGAPVRLWDGVFPDKANTILRQHAVQGDLTEIHSAMCRWLAFYSMISIDVSFSLLSRTLQNILDKWQPMTLDKAEEDMLTNSFSAFDSYCKRAFGEHRRQFHPSRRNAAEEFACLVRCMKSLRDSPFYQKYLPYKRPFHAHLESLIIKSAEDFFDETVESVQDDDPCKELLKLLAVINGSCSRFQQYANIVRELGRIDYCQVTLSIWDRMLNEYLTSELMSERKADLRSQLKLSASQDPPNEDDLVDLVRIHMAFVELRNYRLANRVRGKDLSEWYGLFNRGIRKFLDLAKDKALARISLSCQLDVPICTSSNDMRHSSSHVDVCHIIEQMTVCWERFDVSELTLKIDYTRAFVDILCDIVITYTQKIFYNLDTEGFTGDIQVFVPSPLLQLFCSAINNCEQVRRSLMIHEKLHLDDLAIAYERAGHGTASWKTVIEQRIEETDLTVCTEIDRVVGLLTSRLRPQMKKHVFHLAWSPTAHPVEDSLKPLTDMISSFERFSSIIDIELSSVHKNLLHKNFLRIMSALVGIVAHLLKECVDENPGMEPEFYQRLFVAWHVLVDFFHAGGKGLSVEVLETSSQHMALVKMLSLNQTPTQQLIDKYYEDLLKQQVSRFQCYDNEVSECKYGILNVRAYYNTSSQTLVLDVIGAKQVIPLDANGLSDPFVVIRLVPKYRYPTQVVSKTRVVSKTLNPIFDETFEFGKTANSLPTRGLQLYSTSVHIIDERR
uniref:C2 domain-containing protein n=1 Tax=Angiostrongylus cantonensis TaxID=6313 RepID=A0A0K0D0U6_ANGCA